MMESNSEKKMFEDILRKSGIQDTVSTVKVREGATGDGAMSLTKAVTVTFEDEKVPAIELFVKMQTGNVAHEAFVKEMRLFERESSFFLDYVPEAQQLCSKKGLPNLVDFYPHCYFTSNEIVVLENLVAKGFQLIPHEERHDFHTANVALRTLAKHHAVSHALITDCGGIEGFIKKFPNLADGVDSAAFVAIFDSSFRRALDGSVAILQKHKAIGRDDALTTLQECSEGSFIGMIQKCLGVSKESYPIVALTHG